MGGFDGSHQLSQGWFSDIYDMIMSTRNRGASGWVYSFNRNKWSFLKGPTNIQGGYFVQYDPVHDVYITPDAQTYVYSYHANTTVTYGSFSGLAHPSASVAMDEKRGLLYALQGGSGTVYTLVNCAMQVFNPETGTWSVVTPTSGAIPQGDPNAGGGNEPTLNNIAYDPIHDVMLYINDNMQNTASRVRTFLFHCDTRAWEELSPTAQPADRGRLAFNRALNAFFLFGGEAGGIISRGGSTKGMWAYRYAGTNTEAGMAPAPEGFIDTRGGARLRWKRVPDAGVTGYNVYRATANPYPKGFAKLNTSAITDTFYTDASAASGTAYSYRVCAIKAGIEGFLSRHLYTRPGRPLDVKASVEESTVVKITWPANPEPDVVGYNVYRARGTQIFDAGFPYTKLTPTPVNATVYYDTLVLTDRIARGYVVKAVSAFGCESGPSGAATTFPDPPEWVSTINQTLPSLGLRTVFRWQPPERTRIRGVNLYLFQNTKLNTTGLITDSVTNWPVVDAGTVTSSYEAMMSAYYARAVNILGQEGFLSDEVSAVTTEWGYGLVPPFQRFDYSIYGGPPVRVETGLPVTASVPDLAAYPNPFVPESRIVFSLKGKERISLSIHGPDGKLVRRVADGVFEPGAHRASWDGRDDQGRPVAAGIYVYRLEAGKETRIVKAVLAR